MPVSPTRFLIGGLFLVSALTVTLPACLALLLGLFPSLQLLTHWMVLMASFIHVGIVGWGMALILVVLAAFTLRRATLAWFVVPLVVGLVWQVSWVVPWYRVDTAPHHSPLSLTVLNVHNGRADLDQVIAHSAGSDVVVIVENPWDSYESLHERDFDERFPHRMHSGVGAGRTSIYSRYPMKELGEGETLFGSPLARIDHVSGPILVLGAHPVNPTVGPRGWTQDAAALRSLAQPYLDEPLIIAGDFNAIDRHATLRPLLEEDSLRSTAELTGAGLPRTWPAHGLGAWFGPLIGIDHVLVSPAMTAVTHEEFRVTGTDHVGLRVTVAKRNDTPSGGDDTDQLGSADNDLADVAVAQ